MKPLDSSPDTSAPPAPAAAMPTRPAADRPVVAVVGAGIVGACTALELQRAGHDCWLFDGQPPGQGASYGNAGLISVDSCVPVALPGLLRQLPGWLMDPSGPLSLPPAQLPRAAPWLLRRLRAATPERALKVSDAMHALHHRALALYRSMLGAQAFDALLRTQGQVHVWAGPPVAAPDDFEAALRRRHGIDARWLAPAALQQLVPGIAAGFGRALHFANNAHTTDPRALVRQLVRLHADAGGRLLSEHVRHLLPLAGGGLRLLTDVADHRVAAVVVANGLAAADLVRPLGLRLPLQAERGYHLQLTGGADLVPLPVVQRDSGFVATPMAGGLRLAGTVEIAAAHAPPDERRALGLLAQARRLLPALDAQATPSMWLGSRPSTPDGLPVIERCAGVPGLLLACGHSHFGLTGAPMTARLVAQLLAGVRPELDAAPYALSRFHGAHSRASSAAASATRRSCSTGVLRVSGR